ncbi:hypothetical protein A2369_02735 [candidate division WS6 bacterium RIFOXYB1_FULL_33_15]|nr:MAG: hypothetical protein A2369_02735 [candidate division WS6 bacterium RIFOXYB1_FULL_33_15]
MEYDSEPQKSDSEDKNWQEIEFQLKVRIADAIICKDITDDNPSLTNGCTALEQLIMYEFEIYEIEEIVNKKEEIISFAMDLELDEDWEAEVEVPTFDKELAHRKIAGAVLRGIITDDRLSPWSKLTALDQIICFECGIVEFESIKEERRAIKGIEMDLRGGSKASEEDDVWGTYGKEIY